MWSLGVIHLCEHNWVKLKKKRQQKILEQLHVLFMVCVEVLQIPTMFHISQTPSLRLDPGLEGTASCKSGLHHSCPIRNKNDITMKRFSPASPCFWVCVCVCNFFSLPGPRLRLHHPVTSLALLRLSSAFSSSVFSLSPPFMQHLRRLLRRLWSSVTCGRVNKEALSRGTHFFLR